MTNAKISALTALTSASTDDLLVVVDDPSGSPVTKKITFANLIASFSAVGQLPFPATQSASADANTLDDYEEGSFTPSLLFGGAATGMTYSVQSGRYVTIGQLVFVYVSVTLTAKGSSTGAATIGGLPFAAASFGSMPITVSLYSGMSLSGGFIGHVNGSASTIGLYQHASPASTALAETNFTDTSSFRVGASYLSTK